MRNEIEECQERAISLCSAVLPNYSPEDHAKSMGVDKDMGVLEFIVNIPRMVAGSVFYGAKCTLSPVIDYVAENLKR
jgi:hypothetical protein